VRVPDQAANYIGYRLNILGVRVWRDHCQLVAADGRGQWTPIGAPRSLPVYVPSDASSIGLDALLLTAYQYDKEQPGSDLRQVLAQTKDFDVALSENGHAK
jgi:hypothetical protein